MEKIKAHMAGSISQIIVKENESITNGDEIVVLESMKMQIPIKVNQSGIIAEYHVNEGDFVNEGDLIATIKLL